MQLKGFMHSPSYFKVSYIPSKDNVSHLFSESHPPLAFTWTLRHQLSSFSSENLQPVLCWPHSQQLKYTVTLQRNALFTSTSLSRDHCPLSHSSQLSFFRSSLLSSLFCICHSSTHSQSLWFTGR